MRKKRTEPDSPPGALYGPHTAAAIGNFPISGWTQGRDFIAALGMIKQAAAVAHKESGRMAPSVADALIAAAQEVIDGRWDGQFPIDVFQTGSGTSTNMNANEVIARLAMRRLGRLRGRGAKKTVHPNDHVNMGQSSNDVIPSAIHVAAAVGITARLQPALKRLGEALAQNARRFDPIVKIGRTHLMDAVPIRLGQEFSGYRAQIDHSRKLLAAAVDSLCELPLGGTAVGTGLNAPKGFARRICALLARKTRIPFREAGNHFAAQGAKDAVVFVSGVLKTVAIAMGKIASDIRLLGSGPRCGIAELRLPALQAGSSIMPGKVNPVMCESVIQVACQVIGCDAAIAAGATGGVGGILELNVAMPMIAANLLTAIRLLANAADAFADKCVRGIEADKERCASLVERSGAMVTALAPRIGYDAAAAIAKEALATGKTVRELCRERRILPPAELNRLLDARRQTGE